MVTDMETHFEKQDLSTPLRNPAIRKAIRMLDLPEGSDGLDAGCGIGSHTLLLAEAVGPGGHITGLELFADFILNETDYYAFFTYSLFEGRVAEKEVRDV